MRASIVLMSSMLLAGAALAQSGKIAGTVKDADGKPVPMTPVQASNTATKAVYKATSAASGEYSIGALPAGTYDVAVQVSAIVFEPFVRKGVTVSTDTVRLDIALKDGITLNTLGEDRQALALVFGKAPPSDGPAPRLADGKPDLSGMWRAGALPDDPANPQQRVQVQPWAEAISKQRAENSAADIPSARCLPNGITVLIGGGRFVHTPSLLVMLFEGQHPRQVFLDGRGHPKDLNPTWLGHSTGRWDGDTLVVDTIGLNDKTWLDIEGHPHTEMMHVVERYTRRDLGHMNIETTVEDPGTLVKPWIFRAAWVLDPKEDIQEFLCAENERDAPHLRAK